MPKADPRDALIDANPMRRPIQSLPKEALDDLRYFAEKAEQGKPIQRDALRNYLREKYKLDHFSFGAMARVMKSSGITPWFSLK